MRREAPKIATWLLERFSCSNALAGDLIEQFQQGRSRAWYWRQVFIAVALTIYNDVRFHPVLIARALAVGWGTMYLTQYAFSHLIHTLYETYLFHVLLELPKSRMLFYLLGQPSLLWVMLWTVLCAANGWIVARLHRKQRVGAVLLFSTSVLAFSFKGLPWLATLAVDTWGNSRFLPYLVGNLSGFLLPPLFIVFGGFYGGRSHGIRSGLIGSASVVRRSE